MLTIGSPASRLLRSNELYRYPAPERRHLSFSRTETRPPAPARTARPVPRPYRHAAAPEFAIRTPRPTRDSPQYPSTPPAAHAPPAASRPPPPAHRGGNPEFRTAGIQATYQWLLS